MMDSIGKQMKSSITKEVGKNIGKNPDQASDYLKASNDATKDIKETKKIKKKKEPKEATTSASSGAFSAPAFTTKADRPIMRTMPGEVREGSRSEEAISKRYPKGTRVKFRSSKADYAGETFTVSSNTEKNERGHTYKLHGGGRYIWAKHNELIPTGNNKKKEEKPKKSEPKEATSSSSSGQYSTPKAWAKSFNKKDFRGASKTQIPGGKFVTVKDKCQRFPYCNKGDIKALNIFENERLKTVIKNIEKKHGISENVIKAVIQYELEILEMKKSNKL